MNRRAQLGAAAIMLLSAVACDDKKRVAPAATPAPAASAATAACELRVGDKLGFPFVALCSDEERRRPAGTPAHFISFAPLGCSAGEHETVGCPTITPLGPPTVGALEPRPVALVTALVAHRICSLRFGGRLPTRDELAWSASELGLATLVVAELGAPAEGFRFDPLREWAGESTCNTPAILTAECKVGVHPRSAEHLDLLWAGIRACTARPKSSAAGEGSTLIGTACAAPSWHWPEEVGAPAVLPCAARGERDRSYELACRAPAGAAPPHPSDLGENVAAFRCVVPETALSGVHAATAK